MLLDLGTLTDASVALWFRTTPRTDTDEHCVLPDRLDVTTAVPEAMHGRRGMPLDAAAS